MFGDNFAKELQSILLSKDTISRRIDDIAEDVEQQLFVTSPICVLCDTGQDMTAAHLDECSALNDLNCIVKRYWRARCLMTSWSMAWHL
ncbi:hypothetical protein TNCV_2409091 [Trichonephila clavipes]|nr:hypothetical protein TNCV_2409091 [Trichonephila clavipes]